MIYDIGDRPRTTWTIKLNGDRVDPPTVMLLVRRPDGTEAQAIYGIGGADYPITRDSVGVYYADIPLTASGQWVRRWVAFDELDSPLDATETAFSVRQSAMTEPLGDI